MFSAVRREPLLAVCFIALLIGVAVPFWSVRYLPFLDAPQHLSTIAVLHHLGDPGSAMHAWYTGDLASTQYLLYYLTCDLLSYSVGVEHANAVFLTLYAVLLPLSVLFAAATFGRLKPAALLAFPLVFNAFLFYGFINYVFAFPLLFFGLGLAQLGAADSAMRWGREVLLAIVAVLVFYSHLQIFLVHVGAAGLVALFAWRGPGVAGWKWAALRLVHLAPALLLFGFWILGSSGLAGGEAWEGEVSRRYASLTGAQWEPLHETLSQIATRLLCVYPDMWDERIAVAIGIGVLILLLFRGHTSQRESSTSTSTSTSTTAQQRRSFAPEVLTIFVALFYVCLPTSYAWIWPVNWRFLPLAVLLLLLWGTGRLPRLGETVLTLAFAAVAAGAILLHIERFKAFDAEASDFDEVLAAVTPESRLLSIIFDSGSKVVEGPAYLHFAQYHVVRQGGMAVYSFAEAPQSPIRFRPRTEGGPPPTRLRSEWKPNDFRFDNDTRYYDFFLTRGEPGGFARRVRFDDSVSLVKKIGKWTLYKNAR